MVALPSFFHFLQVWFGFTWFDICLVLAADPVETAEVMTQVLAHQHFFHTGITVPEAHYRLLHLGFAPEGARGLKSVLADFYLVTVFQRKARQQVPYLPTLLTSSVHLTISL